MNQERPSAWQWPQPALILGALAVLAIYALQETFRVAGDRLPGLDSGSHHAWEFVTRGALETGRLPYWNPYLFAGMPHLATLQPVVLYPPAMLLRWLPLDWFLPSMFAVHLWIAGAGTLFLCRVIALGWIPSTAAAIAFMFGGSVAPSLYRGHLLVISCVSWLPWALALSIVSVRRNSLLPHPGLVLVMIVQALSGLQASLYTIAAVCLYFAYAAAWPERGLGGETRWRSFAQLTILGALTAGIGAFHLLPFGSVVLAAGRTTGVPYETAVGGAWSFKDLGTVFFPFLGANAASPYASMNDRAYIGWLLAFMVPVAFLHRRRQVAIYFALAATVALAFALGDSLPFYRMHHAAIPALRNPGRVLFVATLGMAVLGALGLERFVELANSRQWRPLAGAMMLTALALASAVFARDADGTHNPLLIHDRWLPVIAGGVLLVLAVAARQGWPRSALLAGLLMVTVDVTSFAAGGVHTVPTEPVDDLRRALHVPSTGRAISICHNRIGPAELLILRQPTLTGLGSVSLRDYMDWLALLETASRPSDATMRGSAVRLDLLSAANVSTIISCEPLDVPALVQRSSADGIYVYSNPAAWPRVIWTCDVEELPRWQVALRLRRGRYDAVGHLSDRPVIDIRWSETVSDDDRRSREEQYGLRDGVQREESTWRYVLHNESAENLRAILSDPLIQDTGGIDRHAARVSPDSVDEIEQRDAIPETIMGTHSCATRGQISTIVQDQPDGLVAVESDAPVAGYVFMSEPDYAERRAYVDGVPVPTRKTNLAFVTVPVPAGRHRIELRFVPTSFYLGLWISAFTLASWTGLTLASRRAGGKQTS